jgi:hypothetical protein
MGTVVTRAADQDAPVTDDELASIQSFFAALLGLRREEHP